MSDINVKLLSEDNYVYFKNNVERLTNVLKTNDDNSWLEKEFAKPIFIEKKIRIPDFSLTENPESVDKDVDFNNGKALYEALCGLPRYILSDPRFWLWLQLEKFYKESREFIPITNGNMIKRSWLYQEGGTRRCLMMWGPLSRIFYRVALTANRSAVDCYDLTMWAFQNNERYRNLSVRAFSSQPRLVRGVLAGERRAVIENGCEYTDFYPKIAKYIIFAGSVRLLDVFSEEDMADLAYKKMLEFYKEKQSEGKN